MTGTGPRRRVVGEDDGFRAPREVFILSKGESGRDFPLPYRMHAEVTTRPLVFFHRSITTSLSCLHHIGCQYDICSLLTTCESSHAQRPSSCVHLHIVDWPYARNGHCRCIVLWQFLRSVTLSLSSAGSSLHYTIL